jgi:hypothetical protein
MSKDQGYGFLIFLISIIVAIVYLFAFFGPYLGWLDMKWNQWAVGIPVLLFVLLVLVISAWIGWTMLTTPPPAPLEPQPSQENEATTETKTRKRKK